MKKDIEIPESSGIHIAAVREKNEEFQSLDWNAYIINDKNEGVEMVLIVSKGYDNKKATSTMRHSINVLPAKSFAKIEFLQDEVLQLKNEFSVTYFGDGKMYEKTFSFRKNSIKEKDADELPVMKQKGILAE